MNISERPPSGIDGFITHVVSDATALLQGGVEQGGPDRDPAADESVRSPDVVPGQNREHARGRRDTTF